MADLCRLIIIVYAVSNHSRVIHVDFYEDIVRPPNSLEVKTVEAMKGVF